MLYQVADFAVYPGGGPAASAVLTVYTDSSCVTPALLYTDSTGNTAVPNPYTVPQNGALTFWVNSATPYAIAASDTSATPQAVYIITASGTGYLHVTNGVMDAPQPGGLVPVGGIVLWSGTIATIPANWALCDGSTVNGHVTPDLRNQFVIGASADSGGAAQTSVTGSPTKSGGAASATTGAESGHTHASGGSTGSESAHTHTAPATGAETGHTHAGGGSTGAGTAHTHSTPSTGSESGHTHSSGGSTGLESGHTHTISHQHQLPFNLGSSAIGHAASSVFGNGAAFNRVRMVSTSADTTSVNYALSDDVYNSAASGTGSAHSHSTPSTGASSGHTHSSGGATGSESSHTHSDPSTGASTGHTHASGGSTGAGSSHSHTTPSTGASTGHTHSVSTLSPYYALAYIMRVV